MSAWSGKHTWGALALSVMATLIAVFGQNSFIGIFTVGFVQTLELTYTQFGFILMAATLLASALIRQTGRWLDAFGVFTTTLLVVIGGVCSLFLFGLTPRLGGLVSPFWAAVLLGLSLTGFRLYFRGSFRMISSSLVTQTFTEKQRGKAFAVTGVLSALIGSTIPFFAYQLHESMDLLQLCGLMIILLLSFSSLAYALRKTFATQGRGSTDQQSLDEDSQGLSPEEARGSLSFWLYMIGVPFYSLLLSSVILFLDPIAAGSGVSYAKGLSFYVPAAMIGIPFFVWASINMHRSRLVFLLYLASIVGSFLGFQAFSTLSGQIAAFAGFGIASALYTALSMNLWPTLYGRQHVNQYLGMASSFDLLATALGPVLFGFLMDRFSIGQALQISLCLPLAVAALFVLTSVKEPSNASSVGIAIVSFRGRFWHRWSLLLSRPQNSQLKLGNVWSASFVPFWKKSFRYFPNHQFQTLLWQMLERAEQGQEAFLYIFEPKNEKNKARVIPIHEVWVAKGDKFLAFQSIGDEVRELFYAAHGLEELQGEDAVFHIVPKIALRHEVLQSAEVKKFIQEQARTSGSAAEKLARKYFDEIVCDRHYFVSRCTSILLDKVFKRLFFRVELEGVERIRELDKQYQVVYLPSHRSHVDFLATSQLFYKNRIEAPYIATSNHLDFFPVRIIQKISGYFIRRKKMDALYNAVLYQYIRAMQRYGKSHMVFVEGTRSKTGEVLQPKAGIVSQYINAYIEERARPLVFVPINITYDFVLEGDTYLQHIIEFRKELNEVDDEHKKAFEWHLSERKKLGKWMKIKQLLKGIYNLQPKGSAYLTPGEPIFLNDVLEAHRPEWKTLPVCRQEAIPDPWIRELAHRIARYACVEINRVSPLTPGSLVATALLASQGRALSEPELKAYVGATSEFWAKAYGMEVKHTASSLEDTLSSIPFLNQCRRRGERRSRQVAPAIKNMRKGDRRQAQKVFLSPIDSLRSTYNRNNVIHSFVIPHLLSRLLIGTDMLLKDEMKEYFFSQYEPLKHKYHLPWEVDGAWAKMEQFLELFEEKGLLSQGSEAILVNHREDVLAILGIYARVFKLA